MGPAQPQTGAKQEGSEDHLASTDLNGKPLGSDAVPLLSRAVAPDASQQWALHHNVRLVQHLLCAALPELKRLHEASASHNAVSPAAFTFSPSANVTHGTHPAQLRASALLCRYPVDPKGLQATQAAQALQNEAPAGRQRRMQYLPPEALEAIASAGAVTPSALAAAMGPAADIWGLGATVWAILSGGCPPIDLEGVAAVPIQLPLPLMALHLRTQVQRGLANNSAWRMVPADVARLLAWMLEQDRSQRATARELLATKFVRRSMRAPHIASAWQQGGVMQAQAEARWNASSAALHRRIAAETAWEGAAEGEAEPWLVDPLEREAAVLARVDERRAPLWSGKLGEDKAGRGDAGGSKGVQRGKQAGRLAGLLTWVVGTR